MVLYLGSKLSGIRRIPVDGGGVKGLGGFREGEGNGLIPLTIPLARGNLGGKSTSDSPHGNWPPAPSHLHLHPQTILVIINQQLPVTVCTSPLVAPFVPDLLTAATVVVGFTRFQGFSAKRLHSCRACINTCRRASTPRPWRRL